MDSKLVGLQSFETSMKKTIADIFQPYLCKIFSFILYYLPYRDEIVNSLDFVTLSQDPQEIKNKILAFNNEFSIVPPNQISELTKEINQIFSNPNFQWTKITTKDSSIYLWDLIQETYGKGCFKLLPRIFQVAHVLPMSSAGIEQSFSTLKLIRNTLRSNLLEETTQALLLIAQEFEMPNVSDEVIELYNSFKTERNAINIDLSSLRGDEECKDQDHSKITENNDNEEKEVQPVSRKVKKIGLITEKSLSSLIEIEESKNASQLGTGKQQKIRKADHPLDKNFKLNSAFPDLGEGNRELEEQDKDGESEWSEEGEDMEGDIEEAGEEEMEDF